jgi:hypothetical protein
MYEACRKIECERKQRQKSVNRKKCEVITRIRRDESRKKDRKTS